MLRLIIEGDELWDEEKEKFSKTEDQVIELEHSLISISKWESIYQKPFLASDEKTSEEVFGYIRAMILSPDADPDVLKLLSLDNIQAIQRYIDSSQSATTFGLFPDRRGPGEIITSELIYYWLVAFNIPFECQHWHLNRLFSLIRICNIKNSKPKKMSREELSRRYRDLNAERKAKYGTTG
jgi:hypothetical protein